MATTRGLDPENWDVLRQQAHAALDTALDHLETRSQSPVWQCPPAPVRADFTAPLPHKGQPAEALMTRIRDSVFPYDVGNTHPRFFGWVHGSGTAEGLIPEMFATAMNANLGGRDHMANEVEKQVIAWCREMFAFPASAGGLILSGTSMATLVAMKVARDKYAGTGVRDSGLAGHGGLVAYASDQAHSCVARAFDILGLGKQALRRVPVDTRFQMDTGALGNMIAADRAAGQTPFCIVATAGTVNVASIDPLAELADIAAQEGLWFHVDGAFGALAILSKELAPLLAGIERADSLAFDFHKWMHVNYDAGFILMRDADGLRRAFCERPDYLAAADRGLAAGNPWFCEYGPELSRGFRALKVWYQIARFGTAHLGAVIAMNCAQARALARRIKAEAALSLSAPVTLNIVCFRYTAGDLDEAALDALNDEIVIRLQERGLAAPSTTRINGRLAIRINITNHRTRDGDLDALLADVLDIGAELTG